MFVFSGPLNKLPEIAPNGARNILYLLIQTLPTFWAEHIFILIIFILRIFLVPKGPPEGPPEGPGPAEGPPAQPRDSPAQLRGPAEGPGDLEIWDTTNPKNKNLKNQNPCAPFGAISSKFSMDEKMLKIYNFCLFSLVGQWALFTLGGANALLSGSWNPTP